MPAAALLFVVVTVSWDVRQRGIVGIDAEASGLGAFEALASGVGPDDPLGASEGVCCVPAVDGDALGWPDA